MISRAGLSSRRPRKAAWRRMPSAVQARNSTSATSSGLTQTTPRAASAVSFSAKGRGLAAAAARAGATRSRGHLAAEAGADPAGVHELAVLVVAEHQRADEVLRHRGRHVAGDDELLAVGAFRLDPGAGAAGRIGGVALLRDQPLEAEPAGVPQHDLAVLVEMLAEAKRLGRAVQQRRQPVLAGDERLGRAGPRRRGRAGRRGSSGSGRCGRRDRSACSAEKSEAPPAPSTTSSPSRIAVLAGSAASAPPIAAPKRSVQSWPLRVRSFALPPRICACSR